MPTIHDIARQAGVSKSTVSRVLNNNPYVSDEKRKRIMTVIDEINYTPSSIARNFREMSNNIIAVVVPTLYHSFYSLLASGITTKLEEKGYKTIISESFYQSTKEKNILNMLKGKEIEGVILCSVENEWKIIKHYMDYGMIVFCNDYLEEAELPMIYYNEQQATKDGLNHLIDRGHKNIGFCYDVSQSQLQQQRWESYRITMNITDQDQLHGVYGNCVSIHDGMDVGERLMNIPHSKRPTALFAGSDYIAAGVIRTLQRKGASVPEDFAVIGYDDHQICIATSPTISTIHIPIKRLGILTATTMIKYLKAKKIQSEIITFDGELIIREST